MAGMRPPPRYSRRAINWSSSAWPGRKAGGPGASSGPGGAGNHGAAPACVLSWIWAVLPAPDCIDFIQSFRRRNFMARVTIEDCLRQVPTRFGLVHLVAKRVQQIYRGAPVLVRGDNKEIVMAMREIAAGKIIAAKPLPALMKTPEAELLPETEE